MLFNIMCWVFGFFVVCIILIIYVSYKYVRVKSSFDPDDKFPRKKKLIKRVQRLKNKLASALQTVILEPEPVIIKPEQPAYWLAATCPAGFKNYGAIGIVGSNSAYPFNSGGDLGDGLRWYHPVLCYGSFDPAIHINKLWGFGLSLNGPRVGVIGRPNLLYPWPRSGNSQWGDWVWIWPTLESHPSAALRWDRNTGGQIGIISNTTLPFGRGGQLNDDWWWWHPRGV